MTLHAEVSVAAILRTSAWPAAMSAAVTAVLWSVIGFDLGMFIAAPLFAAIVLPPLLASHTRIVPAVICAVAFVDVPGIVLLTGRITPGHAFASYMILFALAAAMCGAVMLLRPILGAMLAAAITTIITLAWLTWPIWLSPSVNASLATWLTPAHPLLAINHVFIDRGVWTHERLMYRYTTLGQDVPYALPSSATPCIVLHGFIAMALLAPALWRERSSRPTAAAA